MKTLCSTILYYRAESATSWVLLKKNVEDSFYTINSDTLPDGTYMVRLVASDTLSNTPESALTGERESRPFTIDNTAPEVNIKQDGISGGRVRVAIEAADLTSTLSQAEISVDAGRVQSHISKGRDCRLQTRVVCMAVGYAIPWRTRNYLPCLRSER